MSSSDVESIDVENISDFESPKRNSQLAPLGVAQDKYRYDIKNEHEFLCGNIEKTDCRVPTTKHSEKDLCPNDPNLRRETLKDTPLDHKNVDSKLLGQKSERPRTDPILGTNLITKSKGSNMPHNMRKNNTIASIPSPPTATKSDELTTDIGSDHQPKLSQTKNFLFQSSPNTLANNSLPQSPLASDSIHMSNSRQSDIDPNFSECFETQPSNQAPIIYDSQASDDQSFKFREPPVTSEPVEKTWKLTQKMEKDSSALKSMAKVKKPTIQYRKKTTSEGTPTSVSSDISNLENGGKPKFAPKPSETPLTDSNSPPQVTNVSSRDQTTTPNRRTLPFEVKSDPRNGPTTVFIQNCNSLALNTLLQDHSINYSAPQSNLNSNPAFVTFIRKHKAEAAAEIFQKRGWECSLMPFQEQFINDATANDPKECFENVFSLPDQTPKLDDILEHLERSNTISDVIYIKREVVDHKKVSDYVVGCKTISSWDKMRHFPTDMRVFEAPQEWISSKYLKLAVFLNRNSSVEDFRTNFKKETGNTALSVIATNTKVWFVLVDMEWKDFFPDIDAKLPIGRITKSTNNGFRRRVTSTAVVWRPTKAKSDDKQQNLTPKTSPSVQPSKKQIKSNSPASQTTAIVIKPQTLANYSIEQLLMELRKRQPEPKSSSSQEEANSP